MIDECVAKSQGQTVHPQLIPTVLNLRLRHFEKANDAAGCRATAEMGERQNFVDAESLYNAACFRAVAAGCYSRNQNPSESNAEADRAMVWLTKAVGVGYSNVSKIRQDKDLLALGRRDDFRKLLADLAAKYPNATAPLTKPNGKK